MNYYGYDNNGTVTVPIRPKEAADMTRRERRNNFTTIPVYHAGAEPTAEEIGRAVRKQREGNPFFRFWGTSVVRGSTKSISHVPAGHEGIAVGYQSDLALETA